MRKKLHNLGFQVFGFDFHLLLFLHFLSLIFAAFISLFFFLHPAMLVTFSVLSHPAICITQEMRNDFHLNCIVLWTTYNYYGLD